VVRWWVPVSTALYVAPQTCVLDGNDVFADGPSVRRKPSDTTRRWSVALAWPNALVASHTCHERPPRVRRPVCNARFRQLHTVSRILNAGKKNICCQPNDSAPSAPPFSHNRHGGFLCELRSVDKQGEQCRPGPGRADGQYISSGSWARTSIVSRFPAASSRRAFTHGTVARPAGIPRRRNCLQTAHLST